MNPNVVASIRAIVDQALTEKNLASKADVSRLVAEAISAELGVAANPALAATAPAITAPEARQVGRKPPQTQEERKAKRAAYQRTYRAKHKGEGPAESEATPAPAAQSAPKPAQTVKKAENGTLPPPIAQVASVDLGDF